MKKPALLSAELGERVSLAVNGETEVRVSGRKRAVVENHRGVLEYTPERICLAAMAGKLSILGSELEISAMNSHSAVICGLISGVDWE